MALHYVCHFAILTVLTHVYFVCVSIHGMTPYITHCPYYPFFGRVADVHDSPLSVSYYSVNNV